MIPIGEAQQKVLEEIPVQGRERITYSRPWAGPRSGGAAARDVPSANNSAMDGFSCRHEDIASASAATPAKLKMVGDFSGRPAFHGHRVGPGEAVRIMRAPDPGRSRHRCHGGRHPNGRRPRAVSQ